VSAKFPKPLTKKLQNKKYRRAFADQSIGSGIATQLYALRTNRGWNQSKLAKETGMAQPRISALEDQNYQNYSLSTLKRIAAAFDVALVVRFVSFGEHIRWLTNVSAGDLAPLSFAEEQELPAKDTEKGAPPVGQEMPTKQDISPYFESTQATNEYTRTIA
jgi:transcriptional regulator with XRE-family HTH domain